MITGKGIGTSQWGFSATSWRSIYTGMIGTVAIWGAELGWRGQKKWEQKMMDLQCQALSKYVNAIRGARKEFVSEIAGGEPKDGAGRWASQTAGENDAGPNSTRGFVVRPWERGLSSGGRRGGELGGRKIVEGLWAAIGQCRVHISHVQNFK